MLDDVELGVQPQAYPQIARATDNRTLITKTSSSPCILMTSLLFLVMRKQFS